jgi:hypothetical protein
MLLPLEKVHVMELFVTPKLMSFPYLDLSLSAGDVMLLWRFNSHIESNPLLKIWDIVQSLTSSCLIYNLLCCMQDTDS